MSIGYAALLCLATGYALAAVDLGAPKWVVAVAYVVALPLFAIAQGSRRRTGWTSRDRRGRILASGLITR